MMICMTSFSDVVLFVECVYASGSILSIVYDDLYDSFSDVVLFVECVYASCGMLSIVYDDLYDLVL
jgi:methylaspartate ammonia-lyase